VRKRLQTKLQGTLPPEELSHIYSSFDIVGDIAIIKTPNLRNAALVAQKILSIHPKVKSVYSPTTRIGGEYRVRGLKLLAGENSTLTRHREWGCVFQVDVDKCYFSPRLIYEHKRLANLVKPGEVIVNMFAGIGCFSIITAKIVPDAKIYSIDVNPDAVKCMQENVRLNRVYGKVLPMLGDSKTLIEAKLQGVADRVLMPLPEKALQYLPTAVSALKASGGCIHYYGFEHATAKEDSVDKTKQKVAECLGGLSVDFEVTFGRIVRSIGPNWWQTVLDIVVLP
jgi:tRNA (guanine37-N1)-methyltransferase